MYYFKGIDNFNFECLYFISLRPETLPRPLETSHELSWYLFHLTLVSQKHVQKT